MDNIFVWSVPQALSALIHPERFKTRAVHFPIQRDQRTDMQRATLGKSGSKTASQLTRSDSESIFQQQLGEDHGDHGFYSIYFNSDTILWL